MPSVNMRINYLVRALKMKTGFENNHFYVEYQSPGRPVGNMRQELDRSVKEISEQSKDKLLLSLSSGLDSQVILHSLHEQELPFTCAFLYMPGYNDQEYKNIQFLENKYNFKSLIVEIDPAKEKDEVLEQAYKEHIYPNNFMHKKFVSLLPPDMDLLTGIEGPDIVINQENGKRFIMEAHWNFENARLRTLRSVNRTGKILNIDRNETSEAFLLSILNDSVVRGYVDSLPYILANDLVDSSGKKPPTIWNWNYYIKPIMLGKHWGRELEYFPKYMGVEKIDWIMNCPIRQTYRCDVAFIEYNNLKKFLSRDTITTVRIHDSNPSSETSN
jgi:hypothetical protein